MPQLNPILATLDKLQTRTAMMAHLTQAVQGETISINRKDLQLAFSDIEQTISAVYDDLASHDESHIDFDEACSDFEQTLSESAPEVQMIEACIIRRSVTNSNDETTTRCIYVPSISEEQRNKCTSSAVGSRYGVELPAYYHDIDVSHFAEKTYYDENGDQQRVLVPLFKDRHSGEHTQTFYQRVGLLLPPID
ncbi:hypothetical protein PSYCG_09990 [Psychrobacter sp. G]|uniref:hypothetical protein n=1 Tax=Psychrobacter sp. G TaxID=571800 RepID=UPI000354AD21|nr:hypothetical protein [Psychrobacter sp. G]AGP49485.1 hypothetical protein PSYCG_09990 [Psychrobacter sp. G]